jgi:hypothetical protein
MRCIQITIFAVEKQLVLHVPVALGTQQAKHMCYIVICGMSGSALFSCITL